MILNRFLIISFLALQFLTFLCGCSEDKDNEQQPATENKVVLLHGAGATFPAPLYQKWIVEYQKNHKDVAISYDAIGSGAGTKLFISEQVDFGASDSAMNDEQVSKVSKGVQLIPATAGSIVLAYNIPDLGGRLRLSRELYVDIFLGKIRFWDDPRIKKENPNLQLPSLSVVTVVRSDSSGTTWAFSNHLSSISKLWREQGPGTGKELDFPGNAMFGSGNSGVSTKIKHSWGSIGYVEYGFAKRAGLDMAILENKAGNFIEPNESSPTETLANTYAQMPSNLRLFLPDPDGDTSYPIVTYSWLLLYKQYDNKEKWEKLRGFVRWGLLEGQKFSSDLGYAPLPPAVAKSALKAIKAI